MKNSASNLKRAGLGRPKGSQNKINVLIKDAVLKAAEIVGDGGKDGLVGYCSFLARQEPRAFASLLGKLIPSQLSAEINVGIPSATKEQRDAAVRAAMRADS